MHPETPADQQVALSLQSPRLTRCLVPAPRSPPLPLRLNGPHTVAQRRAFYPGKYVYVSTENLFPNILAVFLIITKNWKQPNIPQQRERASEAVWSNGLWTGKG